MYLAQNDGIDHINVYSGAKTELGRLLSNFARTPFHYEHKWFASVEGWWYYLLTEDERLMGMWGKAAKVLGRSLDHIRPTPNRDQLLRVYLAKVQDNPYIAKLLKASTLPFTHYYVFGGKQVETNWEWTGSLWAEIRDILKRGEIE